MLNNTLACRASYNKKYVNCPQLKDKTNVLLVEHISIYFCSLLYIGFVPPSVQEASNFIPDSIPLPEQLNPTEPVPFTQSPLDYSLKLNDGRCVRNYQKELAQPGIDGKNFIIIAPTGSGKTLVAALIISDHLQKNLLGHVRGHVVFIVNTKPLAQQQKEELSRLIPAAKVDVYTGDMNNLVADSIKTNNITVCTAGKLLDEVRKSKVKLDEVTLMVFDECHHTRKGHPYARLMQLYLDEKFEENNQLPQIIGMTASPGAGDNPELDRKKSLDHLLNLAALLDATGGLHTVTENTKELQEYAKSSSFTSAFMKSRDATDDRLIQLVSIEMNKLEKLVPNMNCNSDKWSQEYETKIQSLKQNIELQTDPKFRDDISTLELLRCYSIALSLYMDLQQSDAIEMVEDCIVSKFPDKTMTAREREMKQDTEALVKQLKSLPPSENPLLVKLKDVLCDRRESNSRAILFVRTKKHAHAMQKWAEAHPALQQLGIKADVITGHTRETGTGMTQVGQEEVMEKFRKGDTNLLIATSVAEEGLDVPDCDLVIRYLHVSNEIAKVQTEGRARAENSQGFTILSCDSKKKYQEMKNEELIILVQKILENKWFPTGKYLEEKLKEIQQSIVRNRKLKAALKKREKQNYGASSVTLRCKKCKRVACCGSDVYKIGEGENCHYVVPDPKFKEKIEWRAHKEPRFLVDSIVKKTHKIHCSECKQDWGVMCTWPNGGHQFPVLKCIGFVFEIEKKISSFKKWSSVPIELHPLENWSDIESDDSD